MNRPIPVGTLVAVTGIDPNTIKRIARVIEDKGKTVVVETDEQLESEAAIEYDFDTPEQETLEVTPDRLRAIIECEHDWQEQPGEPPKDVCPKCGATRY
jgi:hypothetical protein